MILINLIEIIEISTAFAKYVLNLISTFSFEKCQKSHFILSRVSPIIANLQISNLFPLWSFSSFLKRKSRNQIQKVLCKCSWNFDDFDQVDQNHDFSNHNPKRRKRLTIVFVLRELLTIIKIAKMKNKANEVEISFIDCFHDCRKERKDCQIIKFIFSLQQTTFIHSISSKSIKITMRRGKENEHHQQPLNKFNTPLFNARVRRGQANYTHPTTRFSNIL